MSREFNVVIEQDSEGYFVASVSSLPGCHTQARSIEEVLERIREAIGLCLEVRGIVDEPIMGWHWLSARRVKSAD